MTSETQSEKTTTPAVENKSDNKTVFGPLGKYAVVAVVMVSIIVTTAIMLDKQLNTTEDKLAVIEDQVSQTYAAQTETKSEAVTAATDEVVEVATTETVEMAASTESGNEVAENEVSTADVLVAPEAIESTVASEATSTDALPVEQQARSTEETQFELARNTSEEQQQARIDAFKQQQKQHMAEMFARIKALEAQQLDQYKNGQESQIARLREQIAQQQQQIEALVLRNKDRYDLRAANVQRNQSSREEMLNRI
jgi:hypothetical protein